MFRRKEENANDPSNPDAGQYEASASASDSAPATPALAAATAQANSYVPTGAAPRTASEPARPAVPPIPAASYRPTPIAEFNRGAASRPASDGARATASASPTAAASFGTASEKAPAGKTNRRVLTVGNDILLKGEIATCDRLVIEGRVEAKLSDVHTVEIAEVGSFKGTAEVEDAEVSGVFEGDLVVRNRLVIYASGEVRGNISYGEIEIERGGKLTGQIKTVTAGAAKGKTAFEAEKVTPSRAAKETAAA